MEKEILTTEALYEKLGSIHKAFQGGAAEEETMAAINALWKENMNKYFYLINKGV